MIGELCLWAGLAGVTVITVLVAPHHTYASGSVSPRDSATRARTVRLLPIAAELGDAAVEVTG